MSLIRPFASHAVVRSDGGIGMVDSLGQAMPDDTKIVLTAADLAQRLTNSLLDGARLVTDIRAKLNAERADAAIQATLRALEAATLAGAKVGAQAGFEAGTQAGVKAGAQWTLANSVVRRTIERDAAGQIVGTVEVRNPPP